MNETTVKLGTEEYTFTLTSLPQAALQFYVDNPRVYSYFDRSGEEPTQEEIESVLCEMDSVRELRDAIRSTGGLVDPLVVIGEHNVVIEGNRRLAAYRMLASKDPVKWSMVRCMVSPPNISENAIFILLGQYHLHGQLAWAPFELAGYLYRRIEATNVKPEAIAKEVSKTPGEIKQYYRVYKFMVENNDLDSKNWSFYEELLKSRALKDARASHPELDKAVVKGIKTGEIRDARIDIREKLVKVAKLPDSTREKKLESFIAGDKSLDQIYVEAVENGVDIFDDLKKFRTWISDPDTTTVIRNLNKVDREKYRFELTQINNKVDRLLDYLSE